MLDIAYNLKTYRATKKDWVEAAEKVKQQYDEYKAAGVPDFNIIKGKVQFLASVLL